MRKGGGGGVNGSQGTYIGKRLTLLGPDKKHQGDRHALPDPPLERGGGGWGRRRERGRWSGGRDDKGGQKGA
ncbi:hypothetical protein GCM10019017_22670 [Streptomyces showdoensis]